MTMYVMLKGVLNLKGLRIHTQYFNLCSLFFLSLETFLRSSKGGSSVQLSKDEVSCCCLLHCTYTHAFTIACMLSWVMKSAATADGMKIVASLVMTAFSSKP